LDKAFDKVDGSKPKEEQQEASLGSKIINSLKVRRLTDGNEPC
jgi:hypothetical protein